ncbi:phage tail tape measure protein [Amycolatopsis circi]|uniref:phage tail tape measure protein n=1 Tax=Amycolatopsis circi TaxID=871959 RepID=UPI000E224FF8|nr:phage tail tape measure protein [Amycolatopsis circi]
MSGGKIDILVEPDTRGFPEKLGGKLRSAGGALGTVAKGLGLAVAAGTAVAAVGLKKAIDIGIEYQSSLNELQAVSHATGEQMALVGDTAKRLGADMDLPATSAADAAAAMTELAKGGLSVDQAMTAAKGTLQLAAAAQVDAASAAEIQSQALNAFGLSADQAGHVADVLANSANAASGEITDFAQAMSQVGAVAHQFGLSIDETSTALSLFANAGIKGSDAGTLLKSALLALANPSKPAQKAIEQLGLKVYDAQGKFVGLKSLFEQLHTASEKMTDAQYQQATATVFGSDAVRLAGVAAGVTSDQWDQMATAVSRSGGAADVAAAKTKGLGGAIEGFKSQLETTAIDIFESIGPPLESAVRMGADAVEKYGPVVSDGLASLVKQAADAGKEFGPGIAKGVGAGAGEVASAAERLLKPFVDPAKALGARGLEVGKTIVGGFVDVARQAVDVAEPLAKGAAKIGEGFASAGGPIGAAREALVLGYGAAKLVLQIVQPLAEGVGALAQFFGSLPGPIQTAAFALLAMKVGPPIINSIRDRMSSLGTESDGASRKVGLVGSAIGTLTAPVRAVASGIGGAVGTLRQFGNEAAAQRSIAQSTSGYLSLQANGFRSLASEAAASGQSVGRAGSYMAAFNTSTIPAVAAARGFVEQTRSIRDGAAAAGTPISAMGAAMGTIVERSSALSAARAAFDNASGGAERFGKLAGTAAAGGSLLKSAASGLIGVFGGPWGLALAGASVVLSLFSKKQEEAAAKASAYKQKVDELTNAYKQSGGVIDKNIIDTNNKALADKNVAQNATLAGSSFTLYAAAANGNSTALEEVTKSSDKAIDSIGRQARLTDTQIKGLQDVNHQLLQNGGTYADVQEQVEKLYTTMGDTGHGKASIDTLSEAQKGLLTHILDGTGALGEQIKANRQAQEGYELLASAAAGVSTQTIRLWEAQERQAQSALNAADASLTYRDSLAELKTAQKASSDALKDHGKTSEEYAAAARAEEHALLNVIAAKKAEATANSKAATDDGKLAEGRAAANAEAVRLAETYKDKIPDALRTMIAGMDATSASAAGLHVSFNDLGEAVYKLPDGKEIKVNADVVAAQSAIDKLPEYAAGVTGVMPVDANVDPATGKVNATVQYADGSIGVMTVDANKDPATGKTMIAVQYANGARGYMTVDAFNQGAKDKTLQVVRFADGSVGVITVDAKTGAANAAIDYAARPRESIIRVKTVGGGVQNMPVGYRPAGGMAMEAAGGILKTYAAGGFERLRPMRAGLADIVPPNTWRVIGDRVRDDEAYIPINRSNRSLALLEETARRMGFAVMRRYATGGIAAQTMGGKASAAGLSGPLQISGSLNIGGVLVPLIDARIEAADHASGSDFARGRRT